MEFRGWDMAMAVSYRAVNGPLPAVLTAALGGALSATATGATLKATIGQATLSTEDTGPDLSLTIPIVSGTLTTDDPATVDLAGGTVSTTVRLAVMAPGADGTILGLTASPSGFEGTTVTGPNGSSLGDAGRAAATLAGQALAAALRGDPKPLLALGMGGPSHPAWIVAARGDVRPHDQVPADWLVVSAMSGDHPVPGDDAAEPPIPSDPTHTLVSVSATTTLQLLASAIAAKVLNSNATLAADPASERLIATNFSGSFDPGPYSTSDLAQYTGDLAQVELDDRLRLLVRYHYEIDTYYQERWSWTVSGNLAFGVAVEQVLGVDQYGVGTLRDPSPIGTFQLVDLTGTGVDPANVRYAWSQSKVDGELGMMNVNIVVANLGPPTPWLKDLTARFDGGLVMEGSIPPTTFPS